MDPKDNDDPISKDDTAKSPAGNGKIPVIKIKIPKKAEAAAEEVKSHYCKECDRSFSCGKALGGHMSSAHVQANKDYSLKKLSSKRKASNSGSYSGSSNICGECGRDFRSKKSLFGHMRCHPERVWRGMVPPPDLSADDSSDEDGDQIDSGVRHEVGFRLKGWPTSKRGRGPVPTNPVIRAAAPERENRNDNDSFVAGHQLIKKLKQEEQGKARGRPEINLQKAGGDDGRTLISRDEIESNGLIKGMENLQVVRNEISGTLISSAVDEIDVSDELYMTAIQVLVSGKREKEKGGMIMEEKVRLSPAEKGSSSEEKYKCNICGKYYNTHQALGGHRSSHNKFKLNVVNTITRDAALSDTTPPPRKRKENKINVNTPTNGDHTSASTSVPFAFDLNMAPAAEEDHSSDHTLSES